MQAKPTTAIIVGAGHRSLMYAEYAKLRPDLFQIVGVADPNPVRRKMVQEKFGFSDDMCFETAEELAARGKIADTIINGTMDEMHLPTSIPLLNLGYDMLLEKPFATCEEDAKAIQECARKNGVKVMVCHVLRYAPFYYAIKERLQTGEIGDILNIQAVEHVTYHHTSTAFVRGKWANSDRCHSPMLLSKSCHDVDIITWMMSHTKPTQVASFGNTMQFRPENAAAEAGTVCMVDCPLVDTCLYSTKRLYIDHPDRWAIYVWDALEHLENPTIEDKIALMKSDSPYARCIYKSDNNVVDHQSVLINFASGATGTLNMIGGSAAPLRRLHIVGTKGEIVGNFEDSKFQVIKIDPTPGSHNEECSIEEVDLNVTGDMTGAFGSHGGGDIRLIADFVQYVRGGQPSLACTSIDDSMSGHLTVYRAEDSRLAGGLPMDIVYL